MIDGFDWDIDKDRQNYLKHGVSFSEATHAFADGLKVIIEDMKHSEAEKRMYCIGKIATGIVIVRYTVRDGKIRIFGAGYWRQAKKLYYEKNHLSR